MHYCFNLSQLDRLWYLLVCTELLPVSCAQDQYVFYTMTSASNFSFKKCYAFMSTTEQVIVDIVRTNQILGYWQAGASALILYEYAITLPQEIYLFWYRNVTATVVLFFFARYVAIVYAIASLLLLSGRETALSCEAVNQFYVVSVTLVFITSNAFSAFRVFAVSGRRWLPTLAILFLGVVPVTMEIVSASS